MGRVHCDRLTVTVPKSHDAALRDVAEEYGVLLGAAPVQRGLWSAPSGGTLFYQSRSGYASLEASGRLLADLRGAALLGEYLLALGGLPHRVTRLDACLDVPVRAAPVLHAFWARARSGSVRLSRKRVPATQCGHYFTPALYPGEPLDTGTVYVPSRRSSRGDRFATLYDKRQERIAKGHVDPGPLLRYEAGAARGLGATLADAYDPTALFHHIMSPDIVPMPDGVGEWVPAALAWHGPGRTASDPVRRLERYLEGPAGGALLDLASFPGGIGLVRSWLDRVEEGRRLGASEGERERAAAVVGRAGVA